MGNWYNDPVIRTPTNGTPSRGGHPEVQDIMSRRTSLTHTSRALAVLAGVIAHTSLMAADPVVIGTPVPNAPVYSTPAPVGYAPTYAPFIVSSQPVPSPVVNFAPVYSAPAPVYAAAPVYSTPTYSAPVYSAPVQATTSYLPSYPTLGGSYCPNCANAQMRRR